MNMRILLILLILISGAASGRRTWATSQAPSEDNRCQTIATPANSYSKADMQRRIREAIARGEWQNIRSLFWDGADPAWTRHTKWYRAAVQETLNRDLLHAVATGNDRLISKLIQRGAEVNAKADYDDYMSSLIWAARCGRASTVRLLLENGADVDIRGNVDIGAIGVENDLTALIFAARNGDVEVIKILLAHGANPNAQTKVNFDITKSSDELTGNTPLLNAINNATAKVLLQAGADPNQAGLDGISPLMQAASNGDLARCKLLLALGAKRGVEDAKGQTAADWAREADHRQIEELLRGLQ